MILGERDRLIDLVMRGEMSPQAAEDEASRLGIGRLAEEPEPEDFDPLGEQYWSLPMALAWIAYRTPDAVREWWHTYRAKCLVWRFARWQVPGGPIQEGHFLEARPKPTLSLLQITEQHEDRSGRDPVFTLTARGSIEALYVALRTDCFHATAIDTESGERVTVPAILWQDLEFSEERERDVLRPRIQGVLGRVRFEDVRLLRGSVTTLWPAPKPKVRFALPQVMRPEGGGYMPLFLAALWLATEGGGVEFDPEDVDPWQRAFAALLNHVASGDVLISGVRSNLREPIEGSIFGSCRVDYPYQEPPMDLMMSEEFYVSSHPYIDEQHWRGGFDDALKNRWERRWKQLMVRKADIARLWPFADATDAAQAVAYRTGAPGRPTPIHFVEAEFAARCARGEVGGTLASEAIALARWLKDTYPSVPPLTPGSIENRLRKAYRSYRGPKNKI